MNKQRKNLTIYIDSDIRDEMLRRKDEDGFVISKWVEDNFLKEFIDEDTLQRELDELKQKLLAAEVRLQMFREEESTSVQDISNPEIADLKTVIQREREGKDMKAMCNLYNNKFNKNISLRRFRELAAIFEARQ